ncbi:hypothetical protein SABR111722_20690 [Saccharibacillus brassicae]
MNIQLIRNATLIVRYAGKKFLIDPFLSEQGTLPAFPNAARTDQNNPLVGLPALNRSKCWTRTRFLKAFD